MLHKTVLLHEAVNGLDLERDAVVIDCTLGAGGHGREILSQLGSEGIYVGIDADQTALDTLAPLHNSEAMVHLVHGNFRDVTKIVAKLSLPRVDAVIADLGWRSEQFASGGKGFSFQQDEPLTMTFGEPEAYVFTASDIVNTWDESSIADVIYGYGEERYSRRIAKAIVNYRCTAAIKTSGQLASIVATAVPRSGSRINPATKTFQALRIAVNDELGVLKQLLQDGFALLQPEGRMAIIAFHSLEDRIVKQTFRSYSHDQIGVLVTKKPIIPSEEELQENPRSRSAKLRIIQKS